LDTSSGCVAFPIRIVPLSALVMSPWSSCPAIVLKRLFHLSHHMLAAANKPSFSTPKVQAPFYFFYLPFPLPPFLFSFHSRCLVLIYRINIYLCASFFFSVISLLLPFFCFDIYPPILHPFSFARGYRSKAHTSSVLAWFVKNLAVQTWFSANRILSQITP